MHSSINLIGNLNDECRAMVCLLELIKQEQQCLIEADIDRLTKVTEEKTTLIEKVAALAESRHQGLASAGYAPNDASMQIWLAERSDSATEKMWLKLLEIAQSAKELNRTNGLLINQHLTRSRTALNVLQGTNESGNFYGPNGHSTRKHTPRRLVIG